MRITYYVEDGYVSGSRPQHITISDDELAECETDQEKYDLISDAIDEHFKANVSWSCDISKYVQQLTNQDK